MVEINQGQLSTVVITVAVLVLGVFVADPTLITKILPEQLIPYAAIIGAIIVAVWNYLKPRAVTTEPEAIEESP